MRTLLRVFAVLVLLACVSHRAGAQLTVHTTAYGSKPGYIENATLVVEPHGAYVEQSLYLYYSDHGQFSGSQFVEIVHHFRLPTNAVVNDLWLWIGDSVMQAVMLDTWRARSIYDSITSSLHDPAFLAKRGDVYELHIFPLVSGSLRKVKLNFLTPTRWLGKRGVAELPLGLLQQSNAAKKPLEILFREVEPIWGKPVLAELPTLDFAALPNAMGYRYRFARIDDVSPLTDLTLGFGTDFRDGTFFTSSRRMNADDYFQFGFDPGAIFPLQKDTVSKRLLFALDLSGWHQKNFPVLMPRLKQAMRAAAKETDSVGIVVAGAGSIRALHSQWTAGEPDSIDALMDRFATSAWGNEIATSRLPKLLYTDVNAQTCWQFPGLEQLATVKATATLLDALKDSAGADVIATYERGTWDRMERKSELLLRCDTLFKRGGRLLTYYDFNRAAGNEVVASSYIPGLGIVKMPEYTALLNGLPTGNIGRDFSPDIYHTVFNYLKWDPDSGVRVEVTDQFGHPFVISKRMYNGLLVTSSIWSFRADGALRKLLAVPLLGLGKSAGAQQLLPLLDTVRAMHRRDHFDRAYVFSNSDTLVEIAEAAAWTPQYLAGFAGPPPQFRTVNLLDGSVFLPPYVTEKQVAYYASGYLMKTLAEATQGQHFESHLHSWTVLCSLLDPSAFPLADSMQVTAVANAGAGQLREIREVDPVPQDANKARFFIGAVSPSDSITFTVQADFGATVGQKSWTGTRYLAPDTGRQGGIVPAMLGNEHLKDLFLYSPRDTAAIVSTALRYRLLCNFTALLALEPNDTLHFMRDPFDETKLLELPGMAAPGTSDSIEVSVMPNPFRGKTSIALRVSSSSVLTVEVYDGLGRLIRSIAAGEPVNGSRMYQWDGLDALHRPAAAGLYFLRVHARAQGTGRTQTAHRNILLLE